MVFDPKIVKTSFSYDCATTLSLCMGFQLTVIQLLNEMEEIIFIKKPKQSCVLNSIVSLSCNLFQSFHSKYHLQLNSLSLWHLKCNFLIEFKTFFLFHTFSNFMKCIHFKFDVILTKGIFLQHFESETLIVINLYV